MSNAANPEHHAGAQDSVDLAVTLEDIDEDVLRALVDLAVAEAEPDEVTPPLGEGTGWNQARVEWLLRYHRECRPGLPHTQESTYALRVGGHVMGAVRLEQVAASPLRLEVGIWLARSSRGRGLAASAVEHAVNRAASLHATEVVARTTSDNEAAIHLLHRLGFRITPEHGDENLIGVLSLTPAP